MSGPQAEEGELSLSQHMDSWQRASLHTPEVLDEGYVKIYIHRKHKIASTPPSSSPGAKQQGKQGGAAVTAKVSKQACITFDTPLVPLYSQ